MWLRSARCSQDPIPTQRLRCGWQLPALLGYKEVAVARGGDVAHSRSLKVVVAGRGNVLGSLGSGQPRRTEDRAGLRGSVVPAHGARGPSPSLWTSRPRVLFRCPPRLSDRVSLRRFRVCGRKKPAINYYKAVLQPRGSPFYPLCFKWLCLLSLVFRNVKLYGVCCKPSYFAVYRSPCGCVSHANKTFICTVLGWGHGGSPRSHPWDSALDSRWFMQSQWPGWHPWPLVL